MHTFLAAQIGLLEIDSVEYFAHLLAIVFFFLGSVWFAVELFGKLAASPQEKEVPQPAPAALAPPPPLPAATPAPAPVAPASAAPVSDDSELVAVIAAAVAAVVGGKHRILAIDYVPGSGSSTAWSMEGRRAIYASHSVRR